MATPRELSKKITQINDEQERLSDRSDEAAAKGDHATAEKLDAEVDALQEQKDELIAQLETMTGREVFADGAISDRAAGGIHTFEPTDRDILERAGVDVNELDDEQVAEQIGQVRQQEAAAAEQERNQAVRDLAEQVLGKDVSQLNDEELGRLITENSAKFDQNFLRESNAEQLAGIDRDGLTDEQNAEIDAVLEAATTEIETVVPEDLADKVRDLDAVEGDAADDQPTDTTPSAGARDETSGSGDPESRFGSDFDIDGDLTFGFGGEGGPGAEQGASEPGPDGKDSATEESSDGGEGSAPAGSPGAGLTDPSSSDVASGSDPVPASGAPENAPPQEDAPDNGPGPAASDPVDPEGGPSEPGTDGPGGPLADGVEPGGGDPLASPVPVATGVNDSTGEPDAIFLTESGRLVTSDGVEVDATTAEAVARVFEEAHGKTLDQHRQELAAGAAEGSDEGGGSEGVGGDGSSSDDSGDPEVGADDDPESGAGAGDEGATGDGDGSDKSSDSSGADDTDDAGSGGGAEQGTDDSASDGLETTPDPDAGFTPVTGSGFERIDEFERIGVGRGGDTDPLPEGADGTDGAGGGNPDELKPVRPSDDTVIVRGGEPKPDFGSSTGVGAIDPPPDEVGIDASATAGAPTGSAGLESLESGRADGDLAFGKGRDVPRDDEMEFGKGDLGRAKFDNDDRAPGADEPQAEEAGSRLGADASGDALVDAHRSALDDHAFEPPDSLQAPGGLEVGESLDAPDLGVVPGAGASDRLGSGDDGIVDLDGLG